MEPFDSGSGYSPKPSVSSEKLLEHALRKLENGYMLLVDDQRSNANFFKSGSGYESCSYRVAHKLIQSGVVAESGLRDDVKVYKLAVTEDGSPI